MFQNSKLRYTETLNTYISMPTGKQAVQALIIVVCLDFLNNCWFKIHEYVEVDRMSVFLASLGY